MRLAVISLCLSVCRSSPQDLDEERASCLNRRQRPAKLIVHLRGSVAVCMDRRRPRLSRFMFPEIVRHPIHVLSLSLHKHVARVQHYESRQHDAHLLALRSHFGRFFLPLFSPILTLLLLLACYTNSSWVDVSSPVIISQPCSVRLDRLQQAINTVPKHILDWLLVLHFIICFSFWLKSSQLTTATSFHLTSTKRINFFILW